jgi:acetophenone carboxylase
MFAGQNQFGEMVADITPEINATGCGARFDLDGVNAAGAYFATMADCSDVEATESDRPVLYTFRNFFNGSYGHGKYRGGAGVGFGLVIHDTPALMLGSHGSGSRFPSTVGLFGGYAVPTVFVKTVAGSNYSGHLAESDVTLPTSLKQVYQPGNPERGSEKYENVSYVVRPAAEGDTFYAFAGGGAGYGDVLEREAEQVINDLRSGLVTDWAAKNLYRIAYDEKTLRLDTRGTDAMRQETRLQRKQRGIPFDAFVNNWKNLRPPQEILAYYGAYPHPQLSATQHSTSEGA